MLIIIISETIIIPKSRGSLEGFSPSLEDGDQLHNLSMVEPSLSPDTQNPHSRSPSGGLSPYPGLIHFQPNHLAFHRSQLCLL